MNPATVGMFYYTEVIFAFLFDLIFFDTSLQTMQLIGAAVILTFSIAAALKKKRAADRAK